MEYLIEVDSQMDAVLTRNANAKNISVNDYIKSLLQLYAIDAHIMEQNESWQSGINECAEINLDWANL